MKRCDWVSAKGRVRLKIALLRFSQQYAVAANHPLCFVRRRGMSLSSASCLRLRFAESNRGSSQFRAVPKLQLVSNVIAVDSNRLRTQVKPGGDLTCAL